MNDLYTFQMHGQAFEYGDRLDKVAFGLSALQHIFDGQYRAISNKRRLNERDRDHLQVRITRYRSGSFIADIAAAYTGLQAVFPFISDPKDLWDLTKISIDFLKNIYKMAHDGQQVAITQDGQGNIAVNSGAVHITYSGSVYQIGTQIIGGLREIDDLLEERLVTRVALLGPENASVLDLSFAEKGIFRPPTKISEIPVSLWCDIFDFNKYDGVGRARVAGDQEIPPGNYKFKNIGDQSVEDFILSMTSNLVQASCLIKYQNDPLTETKIAEILVMEILG